MPGMATMPREASRSRMSGAFSTFCSATLSLSITGLGVRAGASRPTQELISKSFRPASMKVGTSGNEGARWRDVTATALIWPPLTKGMAPATAANVTGSAPPTTSATACPPPL